MNRFQRQRRNLAWGVLGLAVMLTAISSYLIWQSAERLRFESYFQLKAIAETLARGIDANLSVRLSEEAERPIAGVHGINPTFARPRPRRSLPGGRHRRVHHARW